jgi:hypothetical protein
VSDKVANYCLTKTGPSDRELRAGIIGDWLKTKAGVLVVGHERRRWPNRKWKLLGALSSNAAA